MEAPLRYATSRALVICVQTIMRMMDVDTTNDETNLAPHPPPFPTGVSCYGAGALICSASSFTNVLSSVMIPPAVSRGTAGSLSRSPPAPKFDDAAEDSVRLFSTSARASQSTFARRPCLRYSQLISASSEPRGTSSARRTNPRERTYAFSL